MLGTQCAVIAPAWRFKPGAQVVYPAIDAGSLTIGFDAQTYEQISVYAPHNRTLAAGSRLRMRYRVAGSGAAWKQAHDCSLIVPSLVEPGSTFTLVDAFAGVIWDLTDATNYEVEFTLIEPGQPTKVSVVTRATLAPFPASGTANKTLTTAGNLQSTLNGLVPGDVLELADGTYTVSGLTITPNGTLAQPIYVRGQSRGGVVIKDTTGNVITWASDYFVLERLTVEGSSTNSGTAASSKGIVLNTSCIRPMWRNIDMRGVDQGIVSDSAHTQACVENCELVGNNPWDSDVNTNATWNDDGIRLPGQGNVVRQSTIKGFGDAQAVVSGEVNVACFWTRNYIPRTGDDFWEGDYATRNCAVIDCYGTNAMTLLSHDPTYGGPTYIIRCTLINCGRGPFKINTTSINWHVYNCTVVRVEGNAGGGFIQQDNGSLHSRYSVRNNVFICRSAGLNPVFGWYTGALPPYDWDFNSMYPDGLHRIWVSSGTYTNFANQAAARTSLATAASLYGTSNRRHQNDNITTSNPFVATVTLGSDHLTEVTAGIVPLWISNGDAAKNSGTPIDGVTDGYTGALPDRGAWIEGRSAPTIGAIRP